jgi:hypothetical protein
MTDIFKAETGVKQGCPLGILFLELYFDPLLKYLEGQMAGINLEDFKLKLMSFRDDLMTFTFFNNF